MKSEVENIDCMIGMARYPDKYFELAIVDPPYGIEIGNNESYGMGRKVSKYKATVYSIKDWDLIPPNKEYFEELFRVSKNQIVWGWNYFSNLLPPSRGLIFWDKEIGENNFSAGEVAYTSFNYPLKKFTGVSRGHSVSSNIRISKSLARIHPCQKPIKLYKWILHNYAKPNDKILDTHLGSGSSRIAAFDMGFDFTGFELDKDYFEAQEKRFKEQTCQLKLIA